jgi:hypothetical protein
MPGLFSVGAGAKADSDGAKADSETEQNRISLNGLQSDWQ